MSKVENINIYLKDKNMFLSCRFVDDSKRDETAAIFTRLTGAQGGHDEPFILHDKFSAKLIQADGKTCIEFQEINNPPGVYGRPMVLGIIPAYLLERGIINKESCDAFNQAILSADVVKSRLSDITANQQSILEKRKEIFTSFKK